MDKHRSPSLAMTLNRVGLVCGLLFVTIVPLIADLRAKAIYTEFERDDVINMEALKSRPAFRGTETRDSVPHAIAGLCQVAQLVNGALLTVLAVGNLILWNRLNKFDGPGKRIADATHGHGFAHAENTRTAEAILRRFAWAVLILLAFGIGYATHFATSMRLFRQDLPASVAEHWQMIHEYQAFMGNPLNNDVDQTGLVGVKEPFSIEPSLAALAAAGELEFVDLVFPHVPHTADVDRYWMKFVNGHPDIINAFGNPSYTEFAPSGEPPLHLCLWFKKTAAQDVQKLIRGLEAMATQSAK